jgi:hypothetical protein
MSFDWQIIPVFLIFSLAVYYILKRFFFKNKAGACGSDCGCGEGIKLKN